MLYQPLCLLFLTGKDGIVSVYDYNSSAKTFEEIQNFKVS